MRHSGRLMSCEVMRFYLLFAICSSLVFLREIPNNPIFQIRDFLQKEITYPPLRLCALRGAAQCSLQNRFHRCQDK